MLAAQLALVLAAMFAGAALYVSVAEHPARMRLDDAAALAQWKPSYARATPMQAGLAILSCLAGLYAWRQDGEGAMLAGAILIGANLPLTLIVIFPVNHRLEAITGAGPDSRVLLGRWARLHALRSVLGAAATIAFLIATLRG